MTRVHRFLFVAGIAGLLQGIPARATNPLILDQFTADPTARVFEGRVYLYPSHDIPARPGHGRPGWFCMEDYHVFSSADLTAWTDHGIVVSQTTVPWVNPATYSLWAPDCVGKNGRYYFFFPAVAKTGGFRIGVAVADRPSGPFRPEAAPIAGVQGIDPCVLLDRDGSAYLFFSRRRIFAARLKDNLLELATPPAEIAGLPAQGLLEGPFAFERHGLYYLTYPHVEHTRERIEYATSTHPLGPYRPAGVILDESPDGCWTIQQSVVEFQGQWYLFYHDNDLSPAFDKLRSVRADRLYFNDDGSIQKVTRTLRGVGLVAATGTIQIDRYSAAGGDGVSVSFLDPARPADGWKLSLAGTGSWVRFDGVDFGNDKLRVLEARAVSDSGGAIEVRLDRPDGPVLGRVAVARGDGWRVVRDRAANVPTGVHDLVVRQTEAGRLDLDWIRFE